MDGPRGHEKWYEKLSRIINSAICFSLVYIIFTYLFWMIMGFAGRVFKFDSFVYYYGIKYILNDHRWSKLKIAFIYSSGPFFCLALGLFCLFFFYKLKNIKTLLHVFFLWGFVIGTSIFASQGIIASLGANEFGSPFYQNLAVVFAWWHIPAPIVYILTIPFMILLVYFAVNHARPFLIFAYSFSKVNKESRRKRYFIETAIVPFVLGAMITTGVTFPMNIFVHFIYMMTIGIALIISWVALTYIEISQDDVLKYKGLQTVNPIFFFLLFAAIFFVYIGWKGINLSGR